MKRLRRAGVFEPGRWGTPSGKPRVVVENPDRSQLWGYAEALRSAGYEVATCAGPEADGRRLSCPLVETGHCSLVDGADLVVSTSSLPEIRSILAALGSRSSPRVILEAPAPAFDELGDAAGDAVLVACPVTKEILCKNVAAALS
jgi:hypothetical protein